MKFPHRICQFLRGQSPGVIRCSDRQDGICIFFCFPDDLSVILVTEHSHDIDDPFSLKIPLNGRSQHVCCCRVMSSVNHKIRFCPEKCKSSWPGGTFQSILSLDQCCGISLFIQDFQCPERCHRILFLIGTCQGYCIFFSFIKKSLAGDGCFQYLCAVPVCCLVRHILFCAYSSYDRLCLRLLLYSYHMTVRFNDAGLFFCYLAQGISKKCRMIHTDGYQNGKNCSTYNVGGIQIAAHTNFH